MDKILNDINGFGKYQKIVLFIIGSMSSLNAMAIFATVFTAAEPKLLCKYRNDENNTNYLNNVCDVWSNITNSKRLNVSSPYQCDWDTQYYGLTIINEWNLICDRVYLAGLTQTAFMIGALVSFFMGYFSDKFGRKTVCLVMSIIMSFSIIISESAQIELFGLSTDIKYVIYVTCQFFLGFTSYVLYVTSYVLLLEITTSQYSTIVSNVNLYIYVVGEIIAMVVAYFAKNWHIINWFLAVYSIIIVLLVMIVLPESPRFLITKKRYKEAYSVLKKIAKVNGSIEKIITENELVAQFKNNNQHQKKNHDQIKNNSGEENNLLDVEKKDIQSKTHESQSLFSYLINPIFNLVKTFLLSYIWIALSMIYYGVSLGITSISSNFDPYLMYFLSSIAEIIGYVCCHLNDKFSRKKVLIGFLGSASLMCLTVALIPTDKDKNKISLNSILIIIFASIGKAMASAAFNSGYVFTSKLYPTNVRNTLVSLVSSIGRVGSLISPQINLLRVLVWSSLPYLIFSGSSLLACLFTLFLPDPSRLNFDL